MKLRPDNRAERLPGIESQGLKRQGGLAAKLARRFGPMWLISFGVCAGIGYALYAHYAKPLLPVPLPKDLEILQPQLRAYLGEQTAWVKASPREASRHEVLGLVYAANGLWAESQAAFLNAIQLNPNEPLSYLYGAVSFQELGATDEAIRRLRALTRRFPQFAPGFYRLGDALERAGESDEAALAFEHLIQLAPAEWRGVAGLGECRLRQGRVDEAVKLLEKAVRMAPREKLAHHLYGQALQRLGRSKDAQRELRLGLDALHYPMPDAWSPLAPQHMKLLTDQIEMARDFCANGRPSEAARLLSAALVYNPTNLNLLNNLALALNQSGQPQPAKIVLQKALKIDSGFFPARVTLSASCLALDQNEEALDHARQAIALNPRHAFPHIALANVLLAMERDSAALAELETAVQCDPQNANLQMDLGDICLRNLNRPTEALEHYRRATELDPVLAPAWLRLAELDLRLGNTNECRAALQEARELTPDDPIIKGIETRLAARGNLQK